jgi:hypothetical protein
MESMNDRIAAVEIEIVPVRSRSIMAIGASSTGLALIERPGSAIRNALTQRIYG